VKRYKYSVFILLFCTEAKPKMTIFAPIKRLINKAVGIKKKTPKPGKMQDFKNNFSFLY